MPTPFPPDVNLNDEQRQQLEKLVRAGSTPQSLVFRARLVLRAAESDHPTNLEIAAEFGCDRQTVAHWRRRFLEQGIGGLQDLPRPGRPRTFSPTGPVERDGDRDERTGRLRQSRHAVEPG
jgi:hypothetical protein